jgi:hypothetical protein
VPLRRLRRGSNATDSPVPTQLAGNDRRLPKPNYRETRPELLPTPIGRDRDMPRMSLTSESIFGYHLPCALRVGSCAAVRRLPPCEQLRLQHQSRITPLTKSAQRERSLALTRMSRLGHQIEGERNSSRSLVGLGDSSTMSKSRRAVSFQEKSSAHASACRLISR